MAGSLHDTVNAHQHGITFTLKKKLLLILHNFTFRTGQYFLPGAGLDNKVQQFFLKGFLNSAINWILLYIMHCNLLKWTVQLSKLTQLVALLP